MEHREREPGGAEPGARDTPAADTPRELKARALRLLMRREHGRAELEKQLAAHAESPADVAALLDELVRRKLLSEDRMAEQRAHTLSRKYGASRVRHDLRARGVGDETIARVTAEAEATEFERAKAIWTRKFRTVGTTPTERAKQMRFLASRGFSGDTIRRVLSQSDED